MQILSLISLVYQNLQKLQPWGQEKIGYELFHTKNSTKNNSQYQRSLQPYSPVKSLQSKISQTSQQKISPPKRMYTNRSQRQIPKTNLQDYFNKKISRTMGLTMLSIKKDEWKNSLTSTKSNLRPLPQLNIKKELQIQRRIFIMMNKDKKTKRPKSLTRGVGESLKTNGTFYSTFKKAQQLKTIINIKSNLLNYQRQLHILKLGEFEEKERLQQKLKLKQNNYINNNSQNKNDN